MTHDELCLRAERYLRSNGFGVVFHDKFKAYTGTGEQPDAIGFRNGVSCLIEVKCSRADFHADKKKHFRIDPETGLGDWRFFMCEPDVIKVEDLPDGWGLLYVTGTRVKKVHGFPPNTAWYYKKPFKANKQAECDYMYSALRRMVVRGHFKEIYEGLPAQESE